MTRRTCMAFHFNLRLMKTCTIISVKLYTSHLFPYNLMEKKKKNQITFHLMFRSNRLPFVLVCVAHLFARDRRLLTWWALKMPTFLTLIKLKCARWTILYVCLIFSQHTSYDGRYDLHTPCQFQWQSVISF